MFVAGVAGSTRRLAIHRHRPPLPALPGAGGPQPPGLPGADGGVQRVTVHRFQHPADGR